MSSEGKNLRIVNKNVDSRALPLPTESEFLGVGSKNAHSKQAPQVIYDDQNLKTTVLNHRGYFRKL